MPAAEPWGACHNQVATAVGKARQEYFAACGRWPADDVIRVHVTDGSIRVVFEEKVRQEHD